MHHEGPVTEVLEVQNENASLLAFLPPFDKALGTRNICIAGLAFSWLLSIFSLFLAIVVLVPNHLGFAGFSFPQHTATILPEALPLAVNILITACIDCLGFIHTASLRWSLRKSTPIQLKSQTLCEHSQRRTELSSGECIFSMLSYPVLRWWISSTGDWDDQCHLFVFHWLWAGWTSFLVYLVFALKYWQDSHMELESSQYSTCLPP